MLLDKSDPALLHDNVQLNLSIMNPGYNELTKTKIDLRTHTYLL